MAMAKITWENKITNAQPPLLLQQPEPPLRRQVLPRYGGCSFGTRSFLRLRWRLTPYEAIAARAPASGTILDLGCGHGLLALTLALQSKDRSVFAVDHDEQRIDLAQRAAHGVANLAFGNVDFTAELENQAARPSGIIIMDAMHYLRYADQEKLIGQAWKLLRPGGRLIVREVDTAAGVTSWLNKMHERFMTWCGFTRADHLFFRSATDWKDLFSGHGFAVTSEPCSCFPFADRLFVCQKE